MDFRSARARIFFWIGLAVLPVFWIWWMRRRDFSKIQIALGGIWTVAFVLIVFALRERLGDHLSLVFWNYELIALRITVALTLWLVVRIFGWFEILLVGIVSVDIIATLFGAAGSGAAGFQLGLWTLVLPVVPAALHLLLPARRSTEE